ncbi:hypothetical protein PoB_007663100 [Plakobranchus ocellatus]|uniref:Uncharacterized protein n=1 Tax=Plakobranchus ocellatus TaxID=259542 RepID=A0AAV4E244_9GAST|nr:hypothetical protein PoB_007663100 [Plakobranchus ocellatus]
MSLKRRLIQYSRSAGTDPAKRSAPLPHRSRTAPARCATQTSAAVQGVRKEPHSAAGVKLCAPTEVWKLEEGLAGPPEVCLAPLIAAAGEKRHLDGLCLNRQHPALVIDGLTTGVKTW